MPEQEKGLTLYALAESMEQLKDVLEANDEPQKLVEYLDAVDLQVVDKVDNIIKFTRNDELSAEAIDKEIERLMLIKRAFVNRRTRLLEYVKYVMQRFDIPKIETTMVRLSFRKSMSVVIDDKEQLPAEFIKVKTVAEPDKLAIKKAIEEKRVVPGAHIEEHQNLQVK